MELLPDIPRINTALAEWLACLVYILSLKKRVSHLHLVLIAVVSLFLQAGIQLAAGHMRPFLWLGGMLTAFAAMFCFIFACCRLPLRDIGFFAIRAFIVAEFAASFEWQLYCFFSGENAGVSVPAWLYLLIIYGLVYSSVYFIERRHIPPDSKLNIRLRELSNTVLMGVVIFLMSNLSFVYHNTPFSGSVGGEIFYIRTLVDFVGIVMLYTQLEQRREADLRRELEAVNGLFRRQYDQYRQSKENDELISRKYHDLKHQIAVIRKESDPEKKEAYLHEMDLSLRRHEAESRTGNAVLDTVLFGKALYCSEHGISFTCIADGTLLNFMEVMDLCVIFGNALDNAIESAQALQDPEKKLISLSVSGKNDFILIQFDNYYENTLELENGLPVTTKTDAQYHGYGIKSIRQAVEKYDGTLTIHGQNNWFSLRILLPLKTRRQDMQLK